MNDDRILLQPDEIFTNLIPDSERDLAGGKSVELRHYRTVAPVGRLSDQPGETARKR